MALTADQLAWIRSRIGDETPPTDADLEAIHTRLGSPEDLSGVVTEVFSKKLATLINAPANFSIPGEYSQNTGENIRALMKQLGFDGDGGGIAGTATKVNIREAIRRWSRSV